MLKENLKKQFVEKTDLKKKENFNWRAKTKYLKTTSQWQYFSQNTLYGLFKMHI